MTAFPSWITLVAAGQDDEAVTQYRRVLAVGAQPVLALVPC